MTGRGRWHPRGEADWDPEELIARWTLVQDGWRLVGTKTGAIRLGFALILKFMEIEGMRR